MQERHIITYINKFLGLKKHALPIYKREIMTILYVIVKQRNYLWDRYFKIHIDYASLKYLLEQKVFFFPSQHLWLAKLLEFDYKIKYKK